MTDIRSQVPSADAPAPAAPPPAAPPPAAPPPAAPAHAGVRPPGAHRSTTRWNQRRRMIAFGALALLLAALLTIKHSRRSTSWRLFPPPQAVHDPNWIEPEGIVLHNSDTPSRLADGPVNAHFLERMHHHDHPSWATEFEGKTYYIGYHYVILPDGTIEKGRPDHCLGCHAKKHNHWLGICLVGAFESIRTHWRPSRPTAPQLRSLVLLCEHLMDEYHIPSDRVMRHRDVQGGTLCPGVRFPYAAVMAQLRSYEASHRLRSLANGVQLPPAPALGIRDGGPAVDNSLQRVPAVLRTVLPRGPVVLRG